MKYHYFNKKGSLLDPIFSAAYILKIVIIIFIALAIWFGFQAAMQNVIAGKPVESILSPIISNLTAAYMSFDYMFPFLVGGLMVVSLIFAFKTGANYIWGIFSIVLWAIAMLLAVVFTNVYIAVSNEFPDLYAQLTIIDVIMLNLRWVVFAWLAIVSAVMFRKNNAEDEASAMQRMAYGV